MNIFTDEAVFLLLSPVSLDLSSTLNHQELFSTNGNLESFIKILPCFTMFHFYFRCTLSLASVGVYKQMDFTETNYESSQQGVGVWNELLSPVWVSEMRKKKKGSLTTVHVAKNPGSVGSLAVLVLWPTSGLFPPPSPQVASSRSHSQKSSSNFSSYSWHMWCPRSLKALN